MKIFGIDLSDRSYYIPIASVIGGLSLIGSFRYYLARKRSYSLHFSESNEDLELPISLEYEYGNFRETFQSEDSTASKFLTELPEDYFNFNKKFNELIINYFKNDVVRNRALIIGTSTGKLAFELSKYFREVKGIEKSFSKVVASYHFQNRENLSYNFPLEGAFRTHKNLLQTSQLTSHYRNSLKRVESLENVSIVNGDPCGNHSLLARGGNFQLIVLPNSLNDSSDPRDLLLKLARCLDSQGIVVIASDYNWKRKTNKEEGFNSPEISTSFEFLQSILSPEFDLVEERNLMDIKPLSLRCCSLHNLHVTVWRLKSIP